MKAGQKARIVLLCLAFLLSTVAGLFSAEERPRDLNIRIADGRISADFQNADLRHVLLTLSQKAGFRLTLGEGVGGNVSLTIRQASLEEVLRRLCRNRAVEYRYHPETGTYQIVSTGIFTGDRTSAAVPADKIPPQGGLMPREPFPPPERGGEDENPRDLQGRLRFQPRELLVTFHRDLPQSRIIEILETSGARVLSVTPSLNLYRVRVKDGMAMTDALAFYNASPAVASARKHALRYGLEVTPPNDPGYASQWGLQKMRVPEAWALIPGGKEVLVAVIDTGIDYSHPDLTNRIWFNTAEIPANQQDDDLNGFVDDLFGWDFSMRVQNSGAGAKNDPLDKDGHGTHVAGIIAAQTGNSLGVAGVFPGAHVMILKVQAGTAQTMLLSDIIDAYVYARNKKARIINCSFGGSDPDPDEYAALLTLRDEGILVICAAGNNGQSMDDPATEKIYPAYYSHSSHPPYAPLDNVLSVAAGDESDRLVSTSNYGAGSVDVIAPGANIYSTCLSADYCWKSGTSMAAPHVSGLAGLIWSKKPSLTYRQVKGVIMENVDVMPDPVKGRTVAANGRVNAYKALYSVGIAGDINHDGRIDLQDAILALQTSASLVPPGGQIHLAADADGDGRIGLPEALYVFQYAAGLRTHNASPVFEPLASRSIPAGSNLTFIVSARDDDGDPLTYSISGLPAYALFDAATRIFSWTPTYAQGGSDYYMTFLVADGRGGAASQTIRITVSATQPLFTAADYFPLQPGDWWDYRVQPGGSIQRTLVANEPATIHGVSATVLAYATGQKDYFTADSEGIKLHGEYLSIPQPPFTGDIVFDHPLRYMPATAGIGLVVTDAVSSQSIPGYVLNLVSTTTVAGLEDVVTDNPLIVLRDCIKVTHVISGSVGGQPVSNQTVTYWFYKGVGCVKMQSMGETRTIIRYSVRGHVTTY